MDFTKIYRTCKGLWVALSPDEKKVIGRGKTVKAAIEQAKRRGVNVPYLFKVPTKIIPYVSGR